MDEFPGLLARDFGFRPQGKSAPMSASKASAGGVGVAGGGIGSGRSSAPAPSWNRSRSGWSTGDSLLGGGISGDRSPPGYDDVFGGPPTYSNPSSNARSTSPSAPPFDSIFEGYKDSAPKNTSLPVYDKPVYDDDIFDGVPGVKNPSSGNYDDIFGSMSSASNHASPPHYDDLLENLGRTMPEPKGSVDKRPKEQDLSGFEELIPGFGGSSPPQQREPPETKQQSATSSAKPTAEDPFVDLETTSTSAYPSSGLFTDPLEHITRPMNSGNPKNDASQVSEGLFDDDELTKSVPLFTSKINDNPKDKIPLKTEKEPSQRPSMETFENIMPKMHPIKSSDSLKTVDRSGVQNSDTSASTYERNAMEDQSPKSYEHLEAADDVWLTVSEIPLFTQPTNAPPPSRPPPPVAIKQAPFGKTDQFSSVGLNSKRKDNESSLQSSQIYQHMKNSVKKMGASPIDELENFASGKPQRFANEHAEVPISEEEIETNSAAAAMKEAMDRAEAKFKHARGVRERERDAKSAKSKESAQQERVEKAMPDAYDPEEDEEKQDRLDREREQREKEEKEEKKRREKEREQELERERERERARQAVERATREARERAAVEARLKAERAAVDKVNAEARQRAERAAVQRVASEARERASAEAREKAERERVAAEARERERVAAEARERERARSAARERASAEKAAVERAATEARLRAQRAAVERAAAEARERAATEAQKRAAAATNAREKQQKAENDLESFFNMGARPSSAPKQRNPASEAVFDAQFQSKGFSDGAQRTTPASSSTIRKAQSTTNIVDDLAFIFGAPSSSGEFQEVEGESEERRRARLERHQRTLERAAKALAEKNERDMQTQRDQAERHRIAETLDIEIKRWAAGKEGNLRALLSTLQYVLWPECGWQPVSLTDLITGASVKKVYRKATLCIHPDKVQQKGATLQQKYIAEKVFDLLKEAWNKFNSEELF